MRVGSEGSGTGIALVVGRRQQCHTPAWDPLQDPLPVTVCTKLLGNSQHNIPGGGNIWSGASPGKEPPQAVHVAGVQTLLLHRSTKKPTERLIIEHMLLGVPAKLSGWSQPHFQAFIQDPDLSPKIISQLFSGTHAVQAEHSAQRHAPPACTAQIPSQIGHLHYWWYRIVAIYSDFPSLSCFFGKNCFQVSGKLCYYLWRKVTLNYLYKKPSCSWIKKNYRTWKCHWHTFTSPYK